jgi:hypothetical protein
MKKIYPILLINAALLSAAFMIVPSAEGDHPDISGMVAEYTGAESCVGCHSSSSSIDVEAHARAITQT